MPALTRSVRGSSNQLLYRVLDEPQLLAAIRELPAPVLVRLIEHVGLEDAAELIALTSIEQLGQVFDAQLFEAAAPGADESFRPERFALFLRLMYEAGESFVLERLLALPRELLTLAFHKLLLVIDIDALTVRFASAGRFDDGLDRVSAAIDDALFEEWEEFRLIARDANAFDDVWNALLLLDREDHELVRDVIERCCDLDGELMEESGLYALLNQEEELESDIVAERSERRAAAGYVAAADARAFLELAGRESIDEAADGRDPITRAYFRELAPQPANHPAKKPLAANSGQGGASIAPEVGGLLALLKEAGVMDDEPEAPSAMKMLSDEGMRRLAGAAEAHARSATRGKTAAESAVGQKGAHEAPQRAAEANSGKPDKPSKGRKGAPGKGASKPKNAVSHAPSVARSSGDNRGARQQETASAAALQPRAQPARGDGGTNQRDKRLSLMAAAMLELRARDGMLHAQRTEELGFLANVLVAGSRHDGRTFRPVEAIECALAVCSVGLERADQKPRSHAAAFGTVVVTQTAAEASLVLEQLSADRLFRAGLYALRVEVAEPARAKIASLLGVDVNDVLAAIHGGAGALVPELALNAGEAVALAALAEQEPWLAGKLASSDHIFIASQADLRRAKLFIEECEPNIADGDHC